jgi:mono/diheme cytochrome c family protein
MADLACFSCHRINGHGGDMAPDLTWEGSSVQREWLVQFFKNPGHAAPVADSPHAALQLTDARSTNSPTTS